MHPEQFEQGQRLQIGSERATVRYVGPVEGQSGEWVGLEWDRTARGKHDGSANGRKYFECLFAEHAGTFVRLEKLQQTARAGCTVLQGLQARYCGASGGAAPAAHGAVTFRLVGEQAVRQHQEQLQLLEQASLAGDCISHAGPDGELAAAAPSLAELDVSGTLVDSWGAALRIAQQLPALRSLDLSRTRLALPPSDATLPADLAAGRLRTLVLNDCRLSWAQVMCLGSSLPNLRELFLCSNRIATLAAPAGQPPPFQQLQVLDLTGNAIADWGEVRRLGSLPSLICLNVCSNQLQDLPQPLPATGSHFSSLKALLCAGNRIASWDTLQTLAQLPVLEDVRVSSNPLFTTGGGERSEVVARMPGLTFLNGSTVDALERRDSELHYLRGLLAQAEEQPSLLPALEASHPRLAPLREKYGLMAGAGLARSGVSHGGSAPMAASMLTLHLVSSGGGSGTASRGLHKPVPACITLKSLRYILQQLHGVPMQRQELLVRDGGGESSRSLAGEDESQTLASLDIKDRSEIRVQLAA